MEESDLKKRLRQAKNDAEEAANLGFELPFDDPKQSKAVESVLLKWAKKGDASCAYTYALRLYSEKKYDQASAIAKWLRFAEDFNEPRAELLLGETYMNGIVWPEDVKRAESLFKKGLNREGYCYLYRLDLVVLHLISPQDDKLSTAQATLDELFALEKDADNEYVRTLAEINIGWVLYAGRKELRNQEEALAHCEIGRQNKAYSDVCDAVLAEAALRGIGGPADPEKAVKLLEPHIKENARCAVVMALAYQLGLGVKKDIDFAKKIYYEVLDEKNEANYGFVYAQAMQNLSSLLFCSSKSDNDALSDAFSLTQFLADEDNPNANYQLGLCYDQGIGTVPDRAKAEAYFKRADDLRIDQKPFYFGPIYLDETPAH